MSDLLTVQETADLLGVHRQTLLGWRKNENMNFPKPVLINRRDKAFKRDEVEHWKNNHSDVRGEF